MRRFFALLACMLLLSGCTKSNIVNATEETRVGNPEFEVQENVEIDWSQVSLEAEEIFNDEKAYPYSRDFHFYLEPNKKQIMLMWVVADDFPDKEIRNYADDLIKGFNDVVAVQDFSIERSGVDSYGGLWKSYGLSFSIVPESTQDEEETWFISGNFAAGTEFQLPDINAMTGEEESVDSGETEGMTEAPAEGPAK